MAVYLVVVDDDLAPVLESACRERGVTVSAFFTEEARAALAQAPRPPRQPVRQSSALMNVLRPKDGGAAVAAMLIGATVLVIVWAKYFGVG